MNANTKQDAPVFRERDRVFLQRVLGLDSALNRVRHTRKFGQNTIAGRVGYPAAIPGNCFVKNSSLISQFTQCAILVGTHEPGESLNIGRKDSRKLALYLEFFRHNQPLELPLETATLAGRLYSKTREFG